MGYFRPLSQTKFINDANLVSYWKLDGNSNDSKGSNNGTDTNMSYSAGQFDNAGVFNGSSSTIALPSGLTRLSSTYTISCWFNTSSIATGANDFYITGDWSASGRNYIIARDGSVGNKIRLLVGNGSTSQDSVLLSNTISASTWYNLVITVNGTTHKIYINGNEDATQTGSYSGGTTANNRSIGSNANTDSWWNGSIDDVAIFSRALSAGEVAELYQSMTLGEYLPNSSTKLLLHLNGSSADSSGNNNNGTDTNITYSQANGKFGQGAGFNGSSSKIRVTTPSYTFSGTKNITISAWINPANVAHTGIIWQFRNSSSAGIQFYLGNQQIVFQVFSGGTFGLDSGDIITASNWQHVVGVYNGTDLRIYVNGVLRGTPVANTANIDTLSSPYYQMGFNADANLPFNGNMDEIMVENRAWSASEVIKYYTQSRGMFGI